jgi:hypothetical protein
MWAMLLNVAEDVRDDKRPDHKTAIAAKADLYQWIKERTEFMQSSMNESDDHAFISYLQG